MTNGHWKLSRGQAVRDPALIAEEAFIGPKLKKQMLVSSLAAYYVSAV